MATHPMAGGSYCTVIGGIITYRGTRAKAHSCAKAARRSGDDPRAFVGFSPRSAVGDPWLD